VLLIFSTKCKILITPWGRLSAKGRLLAGGWEPGIPLATVAKKAPSIENGAVN
jgi:hypothetical protein